MGSVRLRRITLFNFRTFEGRHELEFPERGLMILRGRSGAGKTNVLLGLAYAFGFCRLPAKALQCWHSDKPFYVEIRLETDEGEAVLHRGGQFWLQVGDRKVKGSAKAVEAELDRLCGVEAELREILTYRDQVKPKRFLAMRDTALKEFLVQVLRLHGLEAEVERRAEALGGFAAALERATQALRSAEEVLGRERAASVPHVPQDEAEPRATLLSRRAALSAAKEEAARAQARLRAALEAEEERATQAELAWAGKVLDARAALASARAEASAPDSIPDDPAVSQLKARLVEHDQTLAALLAEEARRREEHDSKLKGLHERRRKLSLRVSEVTRLTDDTARLRAQIARLEDSKCDRCGQAWIEAAREAELARASLANAEKALADLAELPPKIAEIEKQIAEAVFEPDQAVGRAREARAEAQTELGVLRERRAQGVAMARQARAAKVREAEAALSVVEVEQARARNAVMGAPDRPSLALGAEVARLGEVVSLRQAQAHTAESAVQRVELENARALALHEAQARRVADAERLVAKAGEDLARVASEHHREVDYLDLLKGFRNRIFDEVLEDISNAASDVVAALPNTAHIGVQFRSERETSKGVRQEIRPVVTVDGEERPMEESVSGGQLTSIGLAVDLAVGRVISNRLGCKLNWIIFDESFEGHDPATKQACLEVLHQQAADKLVIVVDHMSEFQEMFAQTVHVLHEDKRSRIA